jgi:RNA-directed DNA polymerase
MCIRIGCGSRLCSSRSFFHPLERAKEVTREGEWTRIQYARFADDLVVLVDGQPRHDRLLRQVDGRLREELAKLEVEVNEEKSRAVDLVRGGS